MVTTDCNAASAPGAMPPELLACEPRPRAHLRPNHGDHGRGRHGTRVIRVLVVDESPVVREALARLIDEQPDMAVAGYASDGRLAVREAIRLRPDLITMDAYLPRLDGVDTTREIMRTAPTPIVIVTSASAGIESNITFQAIEAGAVEVLPKPSATKLKTAEERRAFVTQLRDSARAGGFGRRSGTAPVPDRARSSSESLSAAPPSYPLGVQGPLGELSLIAIGASTGGPPCLRVMLSPLDPEWAPPVLVVQHMSAEFIGGLAEWLDDIVACRVVVARSGDLPERGTVYLAPGDRHMRLGTDGRIHLDEAAPANLRRPSIDVLFESIAEQRRSDIAGVLLTGLGVDGAQGLLRLRRAGCLTLVQDEASSVAWGMPGAAVDEGAATYRANPVQLGRLLARARLGVAKHDDE